MILLAGHVAAQSPNEYRLVLAAALDDGVSPVEAKEALYQTIPYVGMAKAYDFVLAANEVMAERGFNCLWKDSRGRRRKIVWKKDWPPKRKFSALI